VCTLKRISLRLRSPWDHIFKVSKGRETPNNCLLRQILWTVLVETSKCNLFFFRRLIHLTIQLCMTLLSLRTYETDYTHLRFGRYWNPHEAIQMNHNNASIFWHRSVKSTQLISYWSIVWEVESILPKLECPTFSSCMGTMISPFINNGLKLEAVKG
jgi:hypothetical protein